jgi:hypothetical protein
MKFSIKSKDSIGHNIQGAEFNYSEIVMYFLTKNGEVVNCLA